MEIGESTNYGILWELRAVPNVFDVLGKVNYSPTPPPATKI
jgi:hypothetical protein